MLRQSADIRRFSNKSFAERRFSIEAALAKRLEQHQVFGKRSDAGLLADHTLDPTVKAGHCEVVAVFNHLRFDARLAERVSARNEDPWHERVRVKLDVTIAALHI